jgi:hypothetical protein
LHLEFYPGYLESVTIHRVGLHLSRAQIVIGDVVIRYEGDEEAHVEEKDGVKLCGIYSGFDQLVTQPLDVSYGETPGS